MSRDFAAEMRQVIDAETAHGPYASPVVAEHIVEKLRATDPELLSGWLAAQAVGIIRHAINLRDDSRQPRPTGFMARVDNTAGPNACWPWLGNTDRYGYGRFGKNNGGAHRIAYELMVGPIPDGLHIDHVCHNADATCPGGVTCPHRRCVNPAHLDPVTNRENLRRSGRLGRSGHVPSNGNAAKTHCPAGHPYDEANTRRDRRGIRNCRTCDRHRVQARRAANRT